VIATCRPGYRLEVAADGIDAFRFERLLAEGRTALGSDDAVVAGQRLREALRLWRGAAFGDLSTEPYIQAEAARLEELRLVAVEERVEADLRLGDHDASCAELEGLVVEHPFRERLWEQWMMALYRAGRQADALRMFQRLRRLLGDELGIEPGIRLVALEEAILLQNPELDWTTTPSSEPGGQRSGSPGRT
jgi:DNA-binding SARP family transcriptional activator